MATSNLFIQLSKIQKELKAPKNQFNKFGNYNFRNCEDILEALKPLLNGLLVILSDEIVLIGDRYYVKSTAKITNGIDTIEVPAYAREAEIRKGMDCSQITGATSSYARKYALNGLFCIDDTKDADTQKPIDKNSTSQSQSKSSSNQNETVTNAQYKKIYAMMIQKGFEDDDIELFKNFLKEKFKVDELTKKNMSTVFENFDKAINSFLEWEKSNPTSKNTLENDDILF